MSQITLLAGRTIAIDGALATHARLSKTSEKNLMSLFQPDNAGAEGGDKPAPRFRYYQGVRYLAPWKPAPATFMRCLSCGRAWDDDKPTALTPAPSGRCPFEYMHRGKS